LKKLTSAFFSFKKKGEKLLLRRQEGEEKSLMEGSLRIGRHRKKEPLASKKKERKKREGEPGKKGEDRWPRKRRTKW